MEYNLSLTSSQASIDLPTALSTQESEDREAQEAIEDLMALLTTDDEITETTAVAHRVFRDIERMLATIESQNTQLEAAAIRAEGESRLLDLAHAGKVISLKQEIAAIHQEGEALHQSALQAVDQIKAQVAAIEASEAESLKVVHASTKASLSAQTTEYQTRLKMLAQSVDAVYQATEQTIQECEALSKDYPSIETAIKAEDLVQKAQHVIDVIISSGTAHGRMQEALAVRNLLEVPREQIKGLMLDAKLTADSEVKIHV